MFNEIFSKAATPKEPEYEYILKYNYFQKVLIKPFKVINVTTDNHTSIGMSAIIFNFRALCIRSPQELLLVISTRGEVFFLFSADRS